MAAPESWASRHHLLQVPYTSVLLGLQLEAGKGLSGPTPAPPGAPPFFFQSLVLLLQDFVLHRLRDVGYKPGRNELDA